MNKKITTVLGAVLCACTSYAQTSVQYQIQNQSQNQTQNQTQNQNQNQNQNADSASNSKTVSVNSTADFTPNPQIAMSSADYPVTAGDVYQLVFAAGTAPSTYVIPVDTTYKVRVANPGVLNAAGLTYLQLKQQVESLVNRNYPMSGVQFVLTSPATFKVVITGEVIETEEKTVWALTRLDRIVQDLFTPYSSERKITVVSTNGKEHSYDLFMARRYGKVDQNPYIRPGDTVRVERMMRQVTIYGAVERPGTYELLDGETLKDLVFSYGNGLITTADTSRIELIRTAEPGSSGEIQYLSRKDIDAGAQLLCYDTIIINDFRDLQQAMFIEGAVSTGQVSTDLESSVRITVTFDKGENYASLVRRNKHVFSASSDGDKAYIIRTEAGAADENGNAVSKIRHIPLNLNEILYDPSSYSPEYVQKDDTLIVPFRQFFVSVSGAVASPSRYPYIPDRDWKYYVGLAGGTNAFQNMGNAVRITDKDGKQLSKSDPIQPESNIEVLANSPWYVWSQYSGGIVTILSLVSTTLSILAVTGALK